MHLATLPPTKSVQCIQLIMARELVKIRLIGSYRNTLSLFLPCLP